MNQCAHDLLGCHYPPGSHFGNQKRDQSALNAIIYANNIINDDDDDDDDDKNNSLNSSKNKKITCTKDEIYWAYATQESLRVRSDETEFNDIVFFSRRGVGDQKYVRRILPIAPRTKHTNETKNVHVDA